jgi:lysophospholipase L1-like esterase
MMGAQALVQSTRSAEGGPEAPNPFAFPLRIVLWAFLILLAGEAALQVRSHLRYGQSVFNVAKSEPMYRVDEVSGLKLLNPNRVYGGSRATIRSNSMGLRSPEISIERSSPSFRVAVIGASSVMGIHARENEDTFPAILERRLSEAGRWPKVEVINAGIAGYTVKDQSRLLEKLILPLRPDLIVLYPGVNDLSRLCRPASQSRASREPLATVNAPRFLLLSNLVRKNTIWFRHAPARGARVDPSSIDPRPYEREIRKMVELSGGQGAKVMILANARSYTRDQPLDVQMKLSETARYYSYCFDLNALHDLSDRYNGHIRKVAGDTQTWFVPLDQHLTGGSRHFVDATHFTAVGENLVADVLAKSIIENYPAAAEARD